MGTLVASDAFVSAVEPARDNYRYSLITLTLNDIERVALHQVALAARNDYAHVQTSDDQGWAAGEATTLREEAPGDRARSEQLRTVTVDSMVPPDRPITMTHLDTEGHEERALGGAMKTIERWRQTLIF